jgi:hypothetical protein
MPCELCGGGDMWIKTCLTPSGFRLTVCDLCYSTHFACTKVLEVRKERSKSSPFA